MLLGTKITPEVQACCERLSNESCVLGKEAALNGRLCSAVHNLEDEFKNRGSSAKGIKVKNLQEKK